MIEFLENGISLEDIRQFSKQVVASAPRLYIQIHKVLERPDKQLPDGGEESKPNPVDREWCGPVDDVLSQFHHTAEWFY